MVSLRLEKETLNKLPVYITNITTAKEEKGTILGDFCCSRCLYTDQRSKAKIQGNIEWQWVIGMRSSNGLQISRSFYDYPIQLKISCSDIRGRTSMIDYFIMNQEIHPNNDIRTLLSANIGLESQKNHK